MLYENVVLISLILFWSPSFLFSGVIANDSVLLYAYSDSCSRFVFVFGLALTPQALSEIALLRSTHGTKLGDGKAMQACI